MVQFQQQITTELLIVDAETGNPQIQIGPGPTMDFFGPNFTMQIGLLQSGPLGDIGDPVVQFFANSDPTNPAFLLFDAAFSQLVLSTQEYTGSLSDTIQSQLVLGTTVDGNTQQITLGFNKSIEDLIVGSPEGAQLVLFPSGVSLFSQADTNTDAAIEINGESSHSIFLLLDSTAAFSGIAVQQDSSVFPVVSVINETWHNLSLQNSWSAWNGGQTPGYLRMNTGDVRIRGGITGGTTTDGTTIATLPAGYRPIGGDVSITVASTGQASLAAGPSRIAIRASSGAIQIFGFASGSSANIDCTFPTY